MGYFVPESVGSAGVGNQKSRGEVFSAARRPKPCLHADKRPARQAFSAVASATCTTGMRYYGYRYYNPELGRFISRDPMEELADLNLFVFVQNRSPNMIDAVGLQGTTSTQDRRYDECEEFRKKVDGTESVGAGPIEDLIKSLQERKCPVALECFPCGKCPLPGAIAGGATIEDQRWRRRYPASGTCRIKVCSDRRTVEPMSWLIHHELIHCDQHCRGIDPHSDCDQCLCSEIEANAKSMIGLEPISDIVFMRKAKASCKQEIPQRRGGVRYTGPCKGKTDLEMDAIMNQDGFMDACKSSGVYSAP